MTFTEFAALLGGLALFLFGMKMMSDGLEQAAGDRMKHILERLTSNRFAGVAVGAGITAVIQSSSATTVMVVGFVNSGLMTLRQAIWVIMGANIGTTITGQLIALDIGVLAPFAAIVGVVLVVFLKAKKLHSMGYIIGGLGVLFIGMGMMSDSMTNLRNSEMFVSVVADMSNPLVGILAGTVFTAIIQSSSASVGILQALAMSGTISLSSAAFVLFGMNIGTCITAVLASIGTSRNARRTTIIHLMFNIIGTTLFTAICLATPFPSFIELLTPANPAAQIANLHTIFNIATSLLLLPFGVWLEKAAKKIIPEREEEKKDIMALKFISTASVKNHTIGSISVAISQIGKEAEVMFGLAVTNIRLAFDNVMDWNKNNADLVERNEEYVDFLNAEISKYISSLMSCEMTEKDAGKISSYFRIIGNIERISDHAVNVSGYASLLNEKKVKISDEAFAETEEMKYTLLDGMKLLNFPKQNMTHSAFVSVKMAEERIDSLTEAYRANQIDRLRDNKCSGDVSVIYSEMITDFERIGDHTLNIAELMEGTNFN